MRTTLQVFGLFTDEGLLTSLSGIGTMCGAAACFSSFLLVLYTVLRGPRARSALLICAALLFVYALVPGVALIRATDDFVYSGFSLHRLWTHHRLSPMLAQIPLLAASLAFPLAIRMALSLSAVREKLDRQPPPTPPATAEES